MIADLVKSYLVLFLMILPVAGCGRGPAPDFSPDAPFIKVVTYNVNWGFVEPGNVVDFALTADADVICFQETHADWEAVLRSQLKRRYQYFVFKEWSGAGGIAICRSTS